MNTKTASRALTGATLRSPYGQLVSTDEARRFFQALDNDLYMALRDAHRSIVVGSPGRGEGKTFLALLLAFYSSQMQENGSTLLVDCTRTCDAVRALNMDPAGTPTLVATPLAEAIRQSPIQKLYVCQVFDAEDRSRLLPREKLNALARMAPERFSTVIVDSDSAQQSNDYVALADFFRNVLIVTQYGRTRKEQLRASLRALSKASCTVLGYIINERRFEIPRWLYGRL